MRIVLPVILGCLIIALVASGCAKSITTTPATTQTPETPKVKVYTPLVGTWKYYKEVPNKPSLTTWTLIFKDDGTYETKGDMIENSTKSRSDIWGAKGTFTVSESEKVLRLTLSYEGKIKTSTHSSYFEINEENSQKQLIFLDDSGEQSISDIGNEGIKYYTIFIKQLEP